ncbi:MAG: hypothetical protein DMG68_20975 [Acidobacteria bacterium]|nr:MAG: hypothetical protein DMG68_20975 [Acidobacteriota bacterium]
MKLSSFFLGTVFAIAVIAGLLLIVGVKFQTPPPGEGAALYNASSEAVLKGVVRETRDFKCPVSEHEIGSHLMLETADGIVLVHLAPGRVMRSQQLVFAPGDQLQVLGSRVRVAGNQGLIAREITKGNEVYVFRDPEGKLLLVQR